MTNYSVLFLAVASIAGSLYGLKNVLVVAPNVDVEVDNLSLRRRLLYDPRTVVFKTPDYARLQSAEGAQPFDATFSSQVREAEDETAALVGRQQPGGGIPQQQQQEGMALPSMSHQSQQLEQVGEAPLMQQQTKQVQGMGGSSMMRQQPQQLQSSGASSLTQEQPQQLQGMGASSTINQQPQQAQEMSSSSMMSEENAGMMQQGSQTVDEQQQPMVQQMSDGMVQRGIDPSATAVTQIGEQGDQQEQSSDKKNLEFIHITKTGGSAIEGAAAKHNIMWSTCHYWKVAYLGCTTPDWEFPKKRLVERMPAGLVYQGEPWHAPPHWNVPNMLEGSDTFVVVRNPYERIVSEYYCSAFGYKGDDRENPEVFNNWLSGNLTLLGEKLQGHMLPQNYYVYDENGNRVVTHILRYENLQPEFDALMERYNLPVRMPPKSAKTVFHFKGNNGKGSAETITVNSISPENIERINEIYARDFEFFAYPKISITPSMSEGKGGTLNPDSDSVLSGATGGGMSPIEGSSSSSSSSSMSRPQILSQDGNGMMMGQQQQEGMQSQESSGPLLSNRVPQQQMMDQDGNGGIMSNGGQQQQQMSMGQVDSVGGQQLGRSSQQQLLSQDDESSSMQLANGGQQQSIGQYSGEMMDNGGQQQLGNGDQQQFDTGGQQQFDTGGQQLLDNGGQQLLDNGGQQLLDNGYQQQVDNEGQQQVDNGGQQQVDNGGQQQVDNGGQQQLVQGSGMMSGNAGQQLGFGQANSGGMSVAGGLHEQPMAGQDSRSMLLPEAGRQQQPMMDQGGNAMATSLSQGLTFSSRSGSVSVGGATSSNALSSSTGMDGSRLLKPEGLGAKGMATSSTSSSVLQAHRSIAAAATSNLRKVN